MTIRLVQRRRPKLENVTHADRSGCHRPACNVLDRCTETLLGCWRHLVTPHRDESTDHCVPHTHSNLYTTTRFSSPKSHGIAAAKTRQLLQCSHLPTSQCFEDFPAAMLPNILVCTMHCNYYHHHEGYFLPGICLSDHLSVSNFM